MSGQCQGWVHRQGPRDRAMRAVLLVIADAANADGDGSYPGLDNLIEFSLYSRSAVLQTIRELVDDRWIEVTGTAKRGQRAIYRVLMTVPDDVHGARTARSELPRHRRDEVQVPSVQILDPIDSDGVQNAEPMGSRIDANGVQNDGSSLYTNGLNVLNTNAKSEPPAAQAPRRGTSLNDHGTNVQAVFDAWKTAADKPGAALLRKRRDRISWALKNYPLADVLDAVVGWQHSPHHRGDNETGTIYNGLDLLLRNEEKLEHFRDLTVAARTGQIPTVGRRGDPAASTQAAARAIAERTTDCPDCNGTLWISDDAGNVTPCRRRRHQLRSAS